MIESNNEEKKSIGVSFYTADEKLWEYENFFVRNWFDLGQIDSIWDTGTAYQKPGLSQQNWDCCNVCLFMMW